MIVGYQAHGSSDMPRADLTLTVPDGVRIGDISRDHPEANIRILAAMTDGETGVGLAEIDAPDPRPVIDAFASNDAVTELDVVKSTCSETLHRAEESMVKRFLAELDPDVDVGNGRS